MSETRQREDIRSHGPRTPLAGAVGRERSVQDRRGREQAEALRAHDAPLPERGPARRALVPDDALGHQGALYADERLQGLLPDRLRRLRAACGERRDSARHPTPRVDLRRTSSGCACQLRQMGAMFDFDSEVVTCDPEYYRWNQWFFLKFFEKGLAYRTGGPRRLVPQGQHDAGAGAGRRSRQALRAVRDASHKEESGAVALQDH